MKKKELIISILSFNAIIGIIIIVSHYLASNAIPNDKTVINYYSVLAVILTSSSFIFYQIIKLEIRVERVYRSGYKLIKKGFLVSTLILRLFVVLALALFILSLLIYIDPPILSDYYLLLASKAFPITSLFILIFLVIGLFVRYDLWNDISSKNC